MDGVSGDLISKAVESVKSFLPEVVLRLDEPLKNHTSFKIGGPVRAMFFPDSTTGLTQICGILGENGITPFVLGNGSNVLASDNKLDLVVVNTSRLDGFELSGVNGPDELNSAAELNGTAEVNGTAEEQYCKITANAGALLSKLADSTPGH